MQLLLKVLFPYPLNSLMAHQVWCGLLSRRKQRQQVHPDASERMRYFHNEAELRKGLCSVQLGDRSGGQILRGRQVLWLVACNGQVEGNRRVVCRMGLDGALVLCRQELRWAIQGVCQAKRYISKPLLRTMQALCCLDSENHFVSCQHLAAYRCLSAVRQLVCEPNNQDGNLAD